MAGFIKNSTGVETQNRVLRWYTLVYVLNGKGTYYDETGLELRVSAGDAIIIPPDFAHWYGPAAGDYWDQIYIEFEGPVFDVWLDKGYLDWPSPVLQLKPVEYWADRFMNAAGKSNDDDRSKMLAEPLRMQTLLTDIQTSAFPEFASDIAWLEKAKNAIAMTQSGPDAAESLGETYDAFRKRFRRLADMSPGRYYNVMRMESACDLLADNGLTLKQLAERLGFVDEYHFSKRFTKIVGVNPSEYRIRITSK